MATMNGFRSITFLCSLGLANACSSDVKMQGESRRAGMNSQDATPPPAMVAAAALPPTSKSLSTIEALSKDHEGFSEVFSYPSTEAFTQTFRNPLSPLSLPGPFSWLPGAPKQQTLTVPAAGPQTKTFTKTAPQQFIDTNSGGKIVVIAGLDTTETFAKDPVKTQRAQAALDELAQDLFNYPLVFIECGFEDASPSTLQMKVTQKGNLSLAQFQASINTAAQQIFLTDAAGVKKEFRSLAICMQLAGAYIGPADVRVLTLLTDAPNCKNNSNQDAADCNVTTDQQPDNAFYLWDSGTAVTDGFTVNGLGVAKNLSVMGAVYRITDGDCGLYQPSVADLPEPSYVGSSQYSGAIDHGLNILYPLGAGLPVAGYGALTGDMCSGDYGIGAMKNLAIVAENLRDRRVRLSSPFDIFTSDPQYNLAISANGAPAGNDVRSNAVAVANAPGSVTVTYYENNNYNKSTYSGLLAPAPDVNLPVTMSWSGGSAHCAQVGSIASGLPANTACAYANTDFIVSLAALPATDPITKKTVPVSIAYTNAVPKINPYQFSAADPIILDSIAFQPPANANVGTPITSPSTDGTTVTLTFANYLPPGNYVVSYIVNDAQKFPLGLSPVPGAGNVVCYLDPGTASIGGDGVLVVTNATPCGQPDSTSVSFRGNGTSVAQTFNVAVKTQVAPKAIFTLSKPLDPGTVVLTFLLPAATAPRSGDDLKGTVDGSILTLNTPLLPGEGVKVDATVVKPNLPGPSFTLSGVAVDNVYHATAVHAGQSQDLVAGVDFKMTPSDQVPGSVVCTLTNNLSFGDRLEVVYTTVNSNSDTTKTE